MSDLDQLPPLRDVIAAHDLRAEKSLGQNFLLDQNITDKIARAAAQASDISASTVFEIGPGPGGLTRSLLRAGAPKVVAIEFDPRAVAALQDLNTASNGRLEIIQGDALDINLLDLAPAPRMIVANLPYNIATPLIVNWLRQIYDSREAYSSMTLMVQKEVGQRMVAPPGDKTYGRLSVLCQWLCNVRRMFDLPPSAFTPPPKVTSSVIQFTPKILEPDQPKFEDVESITAAAFGQRRKMIRSSMKAYMDRVESLGLDSTLRAENISVEDFIRLAKIDII